MNVFECPFSLQARKNPQAPALISAEKTWCYLECEQLIQGATTALKKEGVKKGDPVALLPTKEFPSPLLFFALFRLGAIACPLNTYHPIETLPQQLDELRTPFLLFPDGESYPKIKQIQTPFSRLIKPEKLEKQSFLNKEARATYLFTSGTTSKPKIACHSLGNHYYSALGSQAYLPLGQGTCYHLSLPLYHIAGIALLFRTFMQGGAVALSDEVSEITHTSLIPTQLYRLLKEGKEGKGLHVLLGGAAISPSLYYEAMARGYQVHPSYGMTEMSSQIATHFSDGPFSFGHPLPYREIKLSSIGEIWVRGKTLFQGYVQNDGSLSLPLNAEGYFETSDLGSYSTTSGLQVKGRKDRMFISGGENIQPEEIEKLLRSIDGITYAEVVPTPDEEFGFRPLAYVESEQGVKERELKKYLESFLPKFKIPDSFLDAAGRTRTHKQ